MDIIEVATNLMSLITLTFIGIIYLLTYFSLFSSLRINVENVTTQTVIL